MAKVGVVEASAAVSARDVVFADALTPFAREEQARLVRYVVRAERLHRCSFWGRQRSLTIKAGMDEPLTFEMPDHDDPFDEATDAMFQRLRHFYQRGVKRAASYERISGMLREHAKAAGTAEADRLLQLLDHCDALVENAAMSGPGIGLVREHFDEATGTTTSYPTTPREVFEDWLYGEYLHDDEDRLARIEPWRDLGAHLFTALAVARDLAQFYIAFSNDLVQRVLDEPSLFPPPLAVGPRSADL